MSQGTSQLNQRNQWTLCLPLQMRKMTWWEGICLVQNHKSQGQRKQREMLPQKEPFPIVRMPGAWPRITKERDAALQLLGSGGPAYFYEAWTMRSHSKGQSCLLEKGKYLRNLLLLGKCLTAFYGSETQLDALYAGLQAWILNFASVEHWFSILAAYWN